MPTVGVPVCEMCGYDLRGVGPDGRQTPCPECGAPFTSQSPFVLRPWFPAILLTLFAALAPTMALISLASRIARRAQASEMIGLLYIAMLAAWPVAAVGVPSWAAGLLVRRRLVRPRRTRIGTAIALAAIALNIAGTVFLVRVLF
jgi:hypothetical protein